MCSLEEDLHGINLSLQVDDFDDDGEVKLDIIRGEDIEIERKEEEPDKVSSRSEVSFIPAGRFRPLFLLCGESIFLGFFFICVQLECLRKMGFSKIRNGRFDSWKRLLFDCKTGFSEGANFLAFFGWLKPEGEDLQRSNFVFGRVERSSWFFIICLEKGRENVVLLFEELKTTLFVQF